MSGLDQNVAGHEGGIEKGWTEFNQYLTLLSLLYLKRLMTYILRFHLAPWTSSKLPALV